MVAPALHNPIYWWLRLPARAEPVIGAARGPAPLGWPGRVLNSIHHDLDEVAHLDLGMGVEPVQDTKALGRAVDAGHAVRQRFHGIAGLHGNDLDAQRARSLNFLERQPAEGIDGLARVAVALGGLLPGGENEAVDVAAETQRIDPELPLIAVRVGGSRR